MKKSCSEINSSYRTSCSASESKESAGVSGSDGTCYTCSPISGWCSKDSDCNDSTKKCVNNKCVKKSCGEMGYSTSCGTGYTATNAGVSGSDGTCYTCPATPCPSGYSTSVTSCGSGYTLKTSGYSEGKACGYCEAAKCPDGYSVSVTRCFDNDKLETNGSSGGKPCGKCVLKTCAEMGYPKSCPSGYTTGSNTGSNGSDGMCYPCVKRECPSGYTAGLTSSSCYSYQTYDTDGYSGSKVCGKCIDKPSDNSCGDSDSCSCNGGHRACDLGYECSGVGCRRCSAGSNLALGNCNCPKGQFSDGNGGCSYDCPSGYKKVRPYYMDTCTCSKL